MKKIKNFYWIFIVFSLFFCSMSLNVKGSTEPNLALSAVATCDSPVKPTTIPANINDDDVTTFLTSETNPQLPDYITLTWTQPQNFDAVILKSFWCLGQAPTNFDVEVSEDGVNFNHVVNSGDLVWDYNDGTVEHKKITFPKVYGKKAVRIKMNSYNNVWNIYVINELQVEDSANPIPQTPSTKDFPANPLEKPDWTLVFNDEFNGTALDETKFSPLYLPHYGTNPNPIKGNTATYEFRDDTIVLQIEENRAEHDPVEVKGMKCSSIQTGMRDGLHRYRSWLSIQDHYRGVSNFVTKYGYFELRAKVAKGSGLHSAWWMIGFEDDPTHDYEIDIFETLGANPYEMQINFHPTHDNVTPHGGSVKRGNGKDLSAGFHVYGFEWDENGTKYYLDNELVYTSVASPNYEMTTLLGLYEGSGWTGTVDPAIPYPKEFAIDYFRAYKKNPVTEPTNPNLAVTAVAGSDSDWNFHVNIPGFLNDDDSSTYFRSALNPTLADTIYLDWNEPQTFDSITLKAFNALNQAPTNFDIEVSDDGETGWTKVAQSGNIVWEKSDNTIESKTITFNKVSNKKSLRIKINNYNNTYKYYVINEVQVEDSANPIPKLLVIDSVDASFISIWDNDINQVIDGVVNYQVTPPNRWTTYDSPNSQDWISLDFGKNQQVSFLKLYVYDDGGGVQAPADYLVQYYNGSAWVEVQNQVKSPTVPVGGTVNTVKFDPVDTQKIRVVFTHKTGSYSGLTEIEALY